MGEKEKKVEMHWQISILSNISSYLTTIVL